MFCPKCKSEYRKGITKCPECNVDLVDELPPEPKIQYKYKQFQEVLRTYNAGDVILIKSILDAEKIDYFFLGENFLYVRPMVEPARLMVRITEIQKVKDLLKDLDLQIWSWNLPHVDEDEKEK